MPQILNEETALVPVSILRTHPKNPRQGDIGAIYQSIIANGFYGHLIVQKSTNYVIAGNHRYQAAVQAGMLTVPVQYIDVDDDRALRILLADNRTGDLADYNDNALAELLIELSDRTEAGLEGTGYDNDDLDDLVTKMTKAPDADAGDNPPPSGEGKLSLCVIVPCQDSMEQEQVYEHCTDGGFYSARRATLDEVVEVKEGGSGKRRKRRS